MPAALDGWTSSEAFAGLLTGAHVAKKFKHLPPRFVFG